MSVTRAPTYTDKLITFIENSDVAEDLKNASVALVRAYRTQCATEYKRTEQVVDYNIIQNGKYKGRTIREVMVFDKPYLVWLSSQAFVKKNPRHHDALQLALG
jgi:hypothetical protein